MNIMTLPVVVVVIPLTLIAISFQLWGERGVLICVGIFFVITGIIVAILGVILVTHCLMNP